MSIYALIRRSRNAWITSAMAIALVLILGNRLTFSLSLVFSITTSFLLMLNLQRKLHHEPTHLTTNTGLLNQILPSCTRQLYWLNQAETSDTRLILGNCRG